MTLDLTGQVAIVNGCRDGLGLATAALLVSRGAEVVICGRRQEQLDIASAHIEAEGGNVEAVQLDVTDFPAFEALIADVAARHGRLDMLVNNAAYPRTRDRVPVQELDDDLWKRIVEVNLNGAMFCSKYAARQMLKQGQGGSIISISSGAAIKAPVNFAAYAASKAGLIGMSKALAQELASRNITVNCVAPGFIVSAMTDALPDAQKDALTGRIPAGRLGEGADIAAGVVYLASKEASYVTGHTLHINGGMAMP